MQTVQENEKLKLMKNVGSHSIYFWKDLFKPRHNKYFKPKHLEHPGISSPLVDNQYMQDLVEKYPTWVISLFG